MFLLQVDSAALEATVQLLNGSDVYAPNTSLSAFLTAVASGTFEKVSVAGRVDRHI